ncbi:ABC transporter permease [Acuticoccus sp. I52.16.1]|uniref:ABC transporter permease n=1 Tax=Acuticoccus sp. I52.16.1 TaxID=2928472 RepID=UPI001FD2CBAE|nr:ABC transporter permease [Acuticoccus sp. I52.16.1]UOM35695.1 ABC transporter permease [Acuticoccus sp. I52.16.1]
MSEMPSTAAPARAAPGRPLAFLRELKRPAVAVSVLCLMLLVVCAAVPGLIAPADPYKQSLMQRFAEPIFMSDRQSGYILGGDQVGRDILSRMIYGARMTLFISLGAVAIAGSIGTFLGIVAGYFGGWIDSVVQRVIDMLLAFPIILLVIALVTIVGSSVPALILIMGFASWPQFARIARASVLQVKGLDYIEAARAIGARDSRILSQHILPNILSALIVFTTFEISRMILIEATLSFLGIGVQPPTPTWGGMISEGQQYLYMSWYASFFPGLAIAATILVFNTLGDALRDALDPRMD